MEAGTRLLAMERLPAGEPSPRIHRRSRTTVAGPCAGGAASSSVRSPSTERPWDLPGLRPERQTPVPKQGRNFPNGLSRGAPIHSFPPTFPSSAQAGTGVRDLPPRQERLDRKVILKGKEHSGPPWGGNRTEGAGAFSESRLQLPRWVPPAPQLRPAGSPPGL